MKRISNQYFPVNRFKPRFDLSNTFVTMAFYVLQDGLLFYMTLTSKKIAITENFQFSLNGCVYRVQHNFQVSHIVEMSIMKKVGYGL